MQIVPVIDLMGGQVVRALRGERQRYRPIVSPLCRTSAPLAVARILLDYAAADTLYVADLDALGGGAVQAELIVALLTQHPRLQLWLDAGFRDVGGFATLCAVLGGLAGRVTPVFASEALASRAAARAALADRGRSILSLDRRGEQPLDPAGCWDEPGLWPARVIVMTLERVGSFDGPALDALQAVGRRAPALRLIGAGGIRDEADLAAAAAAGAEAWLTASALHDRRILPRRLHDGPGVA